jgi:hypothetical protein
MTRQGPATPPANAVVFLGLSSLFPRGVEWGVAKEAAELVFNQKIFDLLLGFEPVLQGRQTDRRPVDGQPPLGRR